MSDNQDLNSQETGFEDSPNMVPGEIVSGESISEKNNSKSQFGKLMIAIALLLVAGGWGYAKQDEFKAALGMEVENNFPGCTAGGSCCSHATELTENGEPGMCCHEATVAEHASCCTEMQKNAMVAALLEGVTEEGLNSENSESAPIAAELVVTDEATEIEEPATEEVVPVIESEEAVTPVEEVSAETPAAT
ncbi:MAG TPA: hypothetical protein DD473_13035 [Planctomycetaceae bacterium]|nr:hypothetical protein [Planctomycetaceae bacterium]